MKIAIAGSTPVRRFEVADLNTHGAWLLPRLQQAFPHLHEQNIAGWLRGIVYSNEYQFLFLPQGVCLAQLLSGHMLNPKPMVREIFVWVQDRENKDQIAQAAEFYLHMHVWATHLGAEHMIVEERSDVPHEMIKEKLGRIFIRQEQFAKV